MKNVVQKIIRDNTFAHTLAGKIKQQEIVHYQWHGDQKEHKDLIFGIPEHPTIIFKKQAYEKLGYHTKSILLSPYEAWGFDPEFKFHEHNFEISLVHGLIGKSYAFRLYWPDTTYDRRDGSTGSYALIIPSNQITIMVPELLSDKSKLVEILRNIYPDYDHGKDKMTFEGNTSTIKEINF